MKPISPLGVLIVVFSCLMPAPGGGTFSGIGQYVSADNGELAFSASGSGFSGLFGPEPTGICRVIDTDTPLEGKDAIQRFIGNQRPSL